MTKVVPIMNGYGIPQPLNQQSPIPVHKVPTRFARTLADVPKSQHEFYEWLQTTIGDIFGSFGAYIPCCCCVNPFRVVPQGNAGLLSRFGKVYKVVDPGLHFVNPKTENLLNVNVSIFTSFLLLFLNVDLMDG